MPRLLLQALNFGFFALHSAIVLFNVFGWIWPKTRRANLLLLLLTLFSWVGMGLVYGVGYCVCTDWHFRVREALGYPSPGGNYISFLVWEISGWAPPETLVRPISGSVFVVCLLISLTLNIRDARRKRALPTVKGEASSGS